LKFKEGGEPESELIASTASEMKKYLVDSHFQSLEKALDLYLCFISKVNKFIVVEN
jgi:hypothetical protein